MAANQRKSLRDEFANSTQISTDRPMEKWDKIGKRVRGKFVTIKDGSLRNQRILVLQDREGEPLQISCPTTLEDWLQSVRPGTEIVIEYVRDESKGEGKNPLKHFDVVALKS